MDIALKLQSPNYSRALPMYQIPYQPMKDEKLLYKGFEKSPQRINTDVCKSEPDLLPQNIPMDAPIPLRTSIDLFKSEHLFDSALWN